MKLIKIPETLITSGVQSAAINSFAMTARC